LRERGTQQDLLDIMQSRAELYELLGYKEWEVRDKEREKWLATRTLPLSPIAPISS
jgi:hypothetical protein